MDPEMTILPKGIVVNTKQIYDEIAGHDLVPKDRVWEIWRGTFSRDSLVLLLLLCFLFTQCSPVVSGLATNTRTSLHHHDQGTSRSDSAKVREFLVARPGQRPAIFERTNLGKDIPRDIARANCCSPQRAAKQMGWRRKCAGLRECTHLTMSDPPSHRTTSDGDTRAREATPASE